MAGRNASQNLSGMFYQMNQGLADEGKAGMQFVDTLKRSFAPEVDPNSSESLMNYANYASRNGYKDEFDRYSRMSVMQGQIEQQQAEKQTLADGQLSIANSLSAARNIALDTSMPTEERVQRIQEIEQEARDVAAMSGVDPRTVNTPITALMNHISKTETQGQAATIAGEAADLQQQIKQALVAGKVDDAKALIAEYRPLIQRAQNHGSVDLIGSVTSGITNLMNEVPDAEEQADERAVLRAAELLDTDNSQNEIQALLSTPTRRALFVTEISEREADAQAIATAEQDAVEQQMRIDEDRARAEERASKGKKLGFEPGGALQYLAGSAMERQYIEQYEKQVTQQGYIDTNNRFLQLNNEVQSNRQAGLKSDALIYVNRIPKLLGDTETGDYNPFNKSLSKWANYQQVGQPEQSSSWTQHSQVIAELLHKDARFFGGTEKERLEVAKEYVVKHMNEVDKIFKQAYKNNQEAINAKTTKDRVEREEELGDWETVMVQGKEESTSPTISPNYVRAKYEEYAGRAAEYGKSISYEDWLENVWSRQHHRPTKNPKLYRKERGIPAFKGIQENMDNYVEAKAGRMDPSLMNRDQSWLITDVAERQRANLSPPIGPMGEPEDYETKLRKARRNLPMAYPELDLGESADPYIYPSYTGNRGNR